MRYAWVTGLKPDQVARCEYLHSHPWPAVNKMIKECHIQNYSIYEREIDRKIYFFSYLEYTGSNFDTDMKRMASNPMKQQWWKETDPCQQPLPDAAAKGKTWSDAREVIFLPCRRPRPERSNLRMKKIIEHFNPGSVKPEPGVRNTKGEWRPESPCTDATVFVWPPRPLVLLKRFIHRP